MQHDDVLASRAERVPFERVLHPVAALRANGVEPRGRGATQGPQVAIGLLLAVALVGCPSGTSPTVGAPAPPSASPSALPTSDGPAHSAPATTPFDAYARLRETGLRSKGAAETVRALTSEVGARLAGSASDRAAVAWALEAMKRAGLANVHAEPVKVRRWERGTESVTLVEGQRERPLDAVALGGTVGTKTAISAAVLEVPSLDALEALPREAAKGKIVFLNAPMERTKTGEGYGAAVGGRWRGPSLAAAHSAVGLMIRSVGTDHDAPHTGSTEIDPKKPTVPAVALSGAAADELHLALTSAKLPRVSMRTGGRWLPDADSANVVGELPGRDPKLASEVVLLGAHLDSWDVGTGALDDASGCAIVLEAVKLISSLPSRPRRTLRVVWFAAEEYGNLAGARGYAEAHKSDVGSITVAMEADLGADRAFGVRFLGPRDRRAPFLRIARELETLGIATSESDAHGGADVSPLRRLGVPILDIQQDASRYFDVHHTRNDVFERVDPEAIAQVATAFAVAAYGAAEAEEGFGRIPEDQRDPK